MTLKIGTRKSRLAVIQAEAAAAAIKDKFPDIRTELVYITTEGDRVSDKPLTAIGGRGVFVSEIENALLEGRIDIAVHSAKDMAVKCADGLAVTGVLERGSPFDLLISVKGRKHGNVFGTGSPRRKKVIEKLFPDAEIKGIRGNIDTRLNKLRNGEYDSIVLAEAGIKRLGADMSDLSVMELKYGPCSPCQGIIALETAESGYAADTARAVSHEDTFFCFETERYAMKLMGADCTKPVGAYAVIKNGMTELSITFDGVHTLHGEAPVSDRFGLAERLVSEL